MYDLTGAPTVAYEKLQDVVSQVQHEAHRLITCVEQAAKGWSRVQAALLILRYSLAAKLVFLAQAVDPLVVQPFAARFDAIILDTFQKISDIETLDCSRRIFHCLSVHYSSLKARQDRCVLASLQLTCIKGIMMN